MTFVKDSTISIAYTINDISRYYRNCFDREMAEHGLTRSQWWLLANLQYNNGVSQQVLAEMMDMGKSAVGKIIDQLEKKGWVKRVPNKADKRAYEIYVTDKIQPLIKDIDKEAHALIEKSLADLSERQRNQLQKFLNSIKGQLLDMNGDGQQ